MAKVLSTMIELLVFEVVGETMDEVGEYGEVATSILALLEVVCPWRVLFMETRESNNSHLHDSPPRTSIILSHCLGGQLIVLLRACK